VFDFIEYYLSPPFDLHQFEIALARYLSQGVDVIAFSCCG
jgi:hypothetical protein